MDILFGKDSELHVKTPIGQPGQFSSVEQIEVVTPKDVIKLRIIGPLRPETQIELSLTDARKLGLKPPIRNSGDIAGSCGAKLIGPCGELELKEGIIVASRHVHLYPETAAKYGLQDGDIVDIQTEGERSLTLHNVLVRAGAKHADEIHIDTDEANACNLDSGAMLNVVFNK
jgi:putative phosphotransacetylase